MLNTEKIPKNTRYVFQITMYEIRVIKKIKKTQNM